LRQEKAHKEWVASSKTGFREVDLSNAKLSGTRFVRRDLWAALLPEDVDCVDYTR